MYQNKLVIINNGVGRPFFDGKNEEGVLSKLEYAFSLDSTAIEACLYAGISRYSLYRYLKKNPEFRNRIELLKQTPILIARRTVMRGIKEDAKFAFKFLERKCSKEFAP